MNPTTSPPPRPWAVALAFAMLYLSWGTTFLPIKWGVRNENLPPALFAGLRVAGAGLILLVYQALRGENLKLARSDLLGATAVSWLLFVGGGWLMTMAEKSVDSSVAAVLVATTPLWLGLFAMFWPNETRLTLRGWLGLFIGLGGVIIMIAPHWSDPAALFQDLGPLLVLTSAGSWSLGSLLLRHLRTRTNHLTLAAHQMVLGGGTLTVLGVLLGEIGRLPDTVTAAAVALFCYLLIVGSLIGFVAFNWLLGHVSANKVGTYAYVNPMIAVVVGWLAGETIDASVLLGIATILLGVFLVRGGERSPPSSFGEPVVEGDDFSPESSREIC